MKPLFSAYDFPTTAIGGTSGMYIYKGDAANIANEKIDERIRLAPVVYCDKEENGWHASEIRNSSKTHKAVLMFIEDLRKEEKCEHIPVITLLNEIGNMQFYTVCKKCNTELKASWTEVVK